MSDVTSDTRVDDRQLTRNVADRAFERFQTGLASGSWQPLLEMLTEDFTFFFPLGEFAGENHGRERAAAFFGHVAATFPDGLQVTLDRVTSNDTTVVYEFRDEGTLRGQPYHNRVAVSFDIRGEQVAAYREYFGLIHRPGGGS